MGNFIYEKQEKAGAQERSPKTISLLINSIHYFVECVFILENYDHYRLVVIHGGKVQMDARYDTLRGARISFSKLYRNKAWQDGTKPQWSHFYDPDVQWLNEKTKDIETLN